MANLGYVRTPLLDGAWGFFTMILLALGKRRMTHWSMAMDCGSIRIASSVTQPMGKPWHWVLSQLFARRRIVWNAEF
ncbi:hypothetical protein N825_00315 [Skermanella stibiiresistens SB22]|uniref:Uncharacterized protein n=1 Tax=Skermanella stibiiresistens SB22 TaxID=1385369 RepID=W9H939_9PROT|nr:hypothetical protein N825_00315 [Skermanella stibiiresistens SB22]